MKWKIKSAALNVERSKGESIKYLSSEREMTEFKTISVCVAF